MQLAVVPLAGGAADDRRVGGHRDAAELAGFRPRLTPGPSHSPTFPAQYRARQRLPNPRRVTRAPESEIHVTDQPSASFAMMMLLMEPTMLPLRPARHHRTLTASNRFSPVSSWRTAPSLEREPPEAPDLTRGNRYPGCRPRRHPDATLRESLQFSHLGVPRSWAGVVIGYSRPSGAGSKISDSRLRAGWHVGSNRSLV